VFDAGFGQKDQAPTEKRQGSKRTNGIENLVSYYQSLFDIEENIYHYSPEDYKDAK